MKKYLKNGILNVLEAFIVLLAFFTISIAFSPKAHAENMASDSYLIQFGNFNVTSGEKSSDSFSVTDTVGQIGAGPYGQWGSSSFFVGGGFQYIYQIPDFRFSISKLAINLGEITPGTHNSDSHNLTISTRGAGGYVIYAFEDHPLQHSNGVAEIPDTNCDSGCTISTAGVWTNQDLPGFGFNISGEDVPLDFTDISYFRPFANLADGDPMQVVMLSDNIAENRQSTVTYKAGLSGSQAAGNYETVVTFVAVPGY
jgi:hypothetical protein